MPAGGGLVQPWLLPLAPATSVLAVLGALAARTLPRLIAWLNIASVGIIVAAIGLFTTAAWSAALYYMLQSALVVAALFLLAELVAAQRGQAGASLQPASPVAQPALLGTMLLLAGASITGLPPLPGFIGKLMILQAAEGPVAPWLWSTVLGVGFLTLIGLARAGSLLFWAVVPDAPGGRSGSSPRLLAPALSLLALVIAMAAGAAPLKDYADAAALQLTDRAHYARAVLGADGPASTVRPYRTEGVR